MSAGLTRLRQWRGARTLPSTQPADLADLAVELDELRRLRRELAWVLDLLDEAPELSTVEGRAFQSGERHAVDTIRRHLRSVGVRLR